MDDRRALMSAILANPDEDTPRLALADWLQEHGTKPDQARAEFIRLQIQAANTPPGLARDKLTAAAQKHEAKHRPAWMKPLVAIDSRLTPESYVEFRRGLLNYLWLDTGEFLLKSRQAALPDALAAVGVETLMFFSGTKRVADFAGSPVLRWAARVQFPGLDDKMLAVLAASPQVAHLSGFTFTAVGVTDAGLKAFAQSTGTARLRSLSISTHGGMTSRRPKFTAAGVAALLESDHLPLLDTLEIDVERAKFDVKPLLAAPGIAKLKTLELSPRTPMADVIACPHLVNLRQLCLQDAAMTDADADALLASPTLANLEVLDVALPAQLSPTTVAKLRERFGAGFVYDDDEDEEFEDEDEDEG